MYAREGRRDHHPHLRCLHGTHLSSSASHLPAPPLAMAQPWAAEFKKEGRRRHPPTGFDLSSQEQFSSNLIIKRAREREQGRGERESARTKEGARERERTE
jgi:hypothetical protein